MFQSRLPDVLVRLMPPCALAMAMLAGNVAAQTTYGYAGNSYDTASAPYTTADSLIGSFTTADPIPANFSGDASALVTALSFDDGVAVRSLADTNLCQFEIVTDAAGLIVDWSILLRQSDTGAGDNQHSIDSYGSGFPPGNGLDQVGFDVSTGNTDCSGIALEPIAFSNEVPDGAWTDTGEIFSDRFQGN